MRGSLLFMMCMLCILYSFYLLDSLFTRTSHHIHGSLALCNLARFVSHGRLSWPPGVVLGRFCNF